MIAEVVAPTPLMVMVGQVAADHSVGAVDRQAQSRAVGRELMEALVRRAADGGQRHVEATGDADGDGADELWALEAGPGEAAVPGRAGVAGSL